MAQIMTIDEKLAISNKACALWQAGDEEERLPFVEIAEKPLFTVFCVL